MATAKLASTSASTVLQVFVRNVKGESEIVISFQFNGKNHHMHRPKSQALSQTIQRLSLTVAKSLGVKSEKKKRYKTKDADLSLVPPVSFLSNTKEAVPLNSLNGEAWKDHSLLVIGNTMYSVTVNNPRVIKLHLQELVFEGCPIVPQVSLEFATIDYCKWAWLRVDKSVPVESGLHDFESSWMDSTYSPPTMASAQLLHEGFIYCPTNADVNHQLLLRCTPFKTETVSGNPVYYHTTPVRPAFEMRAIKRRQEHTASPLSSPHQLRVISYNILSAKLVGDNFQDHPFYPYCDGSVLQPSYRYSLLIMELLGYHFDIASLQEVDESFFHSTLLPVMKEVGYDGIFDRKTGKMAEGEAVLFRRSKFELIKSLCISLGSYVKSSHSCKEFFKDIQDAQPVVSNLLQKSTILQLAILKVKSQDSSGSDRYILVANTHLYYASHDSLLRLLQAIICTNAIKDTVNEFKQSLTQDSDISILFCGDFNSCPCTSSYHYLTEGFVSKSHIDWTSYQLEAIPPCGCKPSTEYAGLASRDIKKNLQKRVENGEEEEEEKQHGGDVSTVPQASKFNGLDISNDLDLKDGCGPLDYTHHRGCFVSVLDYIFISRQYFEVLKVVPMPSNEEVTEHVALPSESFPSDHLPLICDLKWK